MGDSQEKRYTQTEVDAIVAQALAQAQTENHQLREQNLMLTEALRGPPPPQPGGGGPPLYDALRDEMEKK